jgi:hypothetical protein
MLAQKTASIQEITNLELRQTTSKRSQHPKQHGCVWAQFFVTKDIPQDLQVGIFRHPAIFPCWLRFSNARNQDDSQGGAHGMAIKLMDVPGKKVLDGEESEHTQDFVLFDSPVFFIKNLQDYQEFELALAQAQGKPPWRFFFPSYNPFSWRLRELYILVFQLTILKRLFKLSSLLAAKYWSGTPYKLGGNYIVKYFVLPRSGNKPASRDRKSANYLRDSMKQFLHNQSAEFDFFVQLQTNPITMPVEDPRIRWWSSKIYKLATIKIPPQIFDIPKQQLFGENLAYNPWHTLPEHEPLGEVNLTRKQVYHDTAQQRQRWNGVIPREPESQDYYPTWSVQNALTVILPIRIDLQAQLLEALQQHASGSFLARSPSTHFARFVILHDPDQAIHQPHLLFTSNYDGALETYLEELSAEAADELDQIFSCCSNYVTKTTYSALSFIRFIQAHEHQSQAFYIASQGSTVESIRHNKKVCDQLDSYLNHPQATSILQSLDLPTLDVSENTHAPRPSALQKLKATVISWLLNLTEYIVGIRKGKNNPSQQVSLNDAQEKRAVDLQELEDRFAQNQMTILLPIRSGFHKQILKLILHLTKRRAQQSKGSLSGISTIHFARWVILEPGVISQSEQSYLLFESNYNGSWDTYINDFVIYAGQRMNLIWGNCIDYPRGGSQDIEWFKQHIRKYQFPANIFYSAYKELTIGQILMNREVCKSLARLRQDTAFKSFISGCYSRVFPPEV